MRRLGQSILLVEVKAQDSIAPYGSVIRKTTYGSSKDYAESNVNLGSRMHFRAARYFLVLDDSNFNPARD